LRVSDDDGATDTDAATIIITDDVIEPAVLYINEVMADNDTTVEDPDEAGAFEDWIELYNPGVDPIDLSGMYLTDDTSDPLQWQIPDGMTIDAGGHLVLWADNDTDQGGAHASFKLSSDGETIALYDIDGTTLIDSIEYGAQTTDVSYGRYPDGADLWGSMTTPTPGAANAPINAPPTAEAGGPYSGTEGDTITLSGAASTDTDGTITAYAWDLDDDGEYDDATGATTAFTATTAGAFTVGLLVSDDDGGTATDTATVTVASDAIEPVVLYINEFMADNDTFVEDPDEAGAYEDWIELYNPGTEAIDLGGMYMTDDLSDPVQWQIPEGMAIDAGGYLVVWADNDTDQGDAHASFKLSTDGETIALYNTDGATLIDAIAFGVQTTDVSYGRYPDGAETWGSMTTPTPGAANTGIVVAPTAEVKGRHIFYNNSYWDDPNNDPALDDNTAIATDKEALLPGEVADFDNYTSYTLGINGIMVDVAGLPDGYTPDAGDFSFRVGNDSAPGDWTPAAAPLDVTLSANAGADGSDRITITWTDNAIEQTWLEVTVLATEVGLSADDVFYFGNAVGETGNDTANALVTAADVIAIRDNPRGAGNRADVATPHDVNRDRLVNAADRILARNHVTGPLNALRRITPTAPLPPPLEAEGEPVRRLGARTHLLDVEEKGRLEHLPYRSAALPRFSTPIWLGDFRQLQSESSTPLGRRDGHPTSPLPIDAGQLPPAALDHALAELLADAVR